MPCGKGLRCRQYSCPSLCHSGHCPPCLETVFIDLTCACERSSIPSPQLHISMLSFTILWPFIFLELSFRRLSTLFSSYSKRIHWWTCGCGSRNIRCNKLCCKTRQCGIYACARTCHLSPCNSSCGPSFNLKASGGQMSGAPKRECRHACTALYYHFSPCPDVRCELPATITCSCGRIIATVPCDVRGNSVGFNDDTIFEASVIQKLIKIRLSQRKHMCDDECAKMQRKRAVVDVFGVTIPNLDTFKFLVLGRGKAILFTFMYFIHC
ncbi:hypothetical protein ACSBR1_024921 [Camellia fascicularis]